MNKSIDQMNQLIDILLDFDENPNQPKEYNIKLYHITLDMINNPDIYGDVREIVTDLHRSMQLYNVFSFNFEVELNPDIEFGLIAAKLCGYLPIEIEQ